MPSLILEYVRAPLQRDGHCFAATNRAEASAAAMQSALAAMEDAQARREQGDTSEETAQEIVHAAMAYAKNRAGYDAHSARAADGEREAQQALSGVLSAARVQAKGRLRQEDERLQKALASRQAAGASAATRA